VKRKPSGSAFYLPLHSFFRIHGHGDEDGDKFIGFPPNWFDIICRHAAIVLQEFQPNFALVSLLDALLNLGDKFGFRPRARRLSACEIILAPAFDITLAVSCFQIPLTPESILFIQTRFVIN